MWKFIVTTRKINMRISNKDYMYLLYNYILKIILFFISFLAQHKIDVFKYEYVFNVI